LQKTKILAKDTDEKFDVLVLLNRQLDGEAVERGLSSSTASPPHQVIRSSG
jgi:hypothetical protein